MHLFNMIYTHRKQLDIPQTEENEKGTMCEQDGYIWSCVWESEREGARVTRRTCPEASCNVS